MLAYLAAMFVERANGGSRCRIIRAIGLGSRLSQPELPPCHCLMDDQTCRWSGIRGRRSRLRMDASCCGSGDEIILTASASEVGARPGGAYAIGAAARAVADHEAGSSTQVLAAFLRHRRLTIPGLALALKTLLLLVRAASAKATPVEVINPALVLVINPVLIPAINPAEMVVLAAGFAANSSNVSPSPLQGEGLLAALGSSVARRAVRGVSIANVEGVDHGSLQARMALQQPIDAHAQERRQLDELQRREGQLDEVDVELDHVILAKRVFRSRGDATPGLQAGLRPDQVDDIVHFGREPGRDVVPPSGSAMIGSSII